MFPRPGLNQVFFGKKMGIGKLSFWFGFNAFILALLLPVCPLTKAISRFLFTKLLIWNTKLNKS